VFAQFVGRPAPCLRPGLGLVEAITGFVVMPREIARQLSATRLLAGSAAAVEGGEASRRRSASGWGKKRLFAPVAIGKFQEEIFAALAISSKRSAAGLRDRRHRTRS